jgi:hypothetical protein
MFFKKKKKEKKRKEKAFPAVKANRERFLGDKNRLRRSRRRRLGKKQ